MGLPPARPPTPLKEEEEPPPSPLAKRPVPTTGGRPEGPAAAEEEEDEEVAYRLEAEAVGRPLRKLPRLSRPPGPEYCGSGRKKWVWKRRKRGPCGEC